LGLEHVPASHSENASKKDTKPTTRTRTTTNTQKQDEKRVMDRKFATFHAFLFHPKNNEK
jgi:hypothetical protein